jgi:hypothetical protein
VRVREALFSIGEVTMSENVAELGQPVMQKPLLMLDPDRLKPLPKDLWDMPCSACGKLEAKWGFLPSDPVEEVNGVAPEVEPLTLCSLCFLYESEWGKRRRADLDAMIASLESELTTRVRDEHARKATLSPEQFLAINIVFPKSPEGRLLDNKDANRVVGSIAILSRMIMSKLDVADALQQKLDEQRVITPDHPQFGPKRTF